MSDRDSSRAALMATIVVLLVALAVIFILWQGDEESEDLEIQVGAREAGALVRPAAAERAPRHLRLERS